MIEIRVTGFKEEKEAAKQRIQGSTQRRKSKETDSLLRVLKKQRNRFSPQSLQREPSLSTWVLLLSDSFQTSDLYNYKKIHFFFLNH